MAFAIYGSLRAIPLSVHGFGSFAVLGGDLFPLLFFFEFGFGVLLSVEIGHFALEFAVTVVATCIECAAFEGFLNGTSRFVVMLAVSELAIFCHFFDIIECL